MSQPTILWVQDESDGPVNGLVNYQDEKLWFSRSTIDESGVRLYNLYRLSEDNLNLITLNHVNYCEDTGAPLHHGDSYKIKSRKATPNKGSGVRCMLSSNEFQHLIVPSDVTGELVTTIKETDFLNYHVPHMCEFIL